MTKYVIDAGGNVGDSQAAKLGSHFSIMMLIQVPAAQVDSLKQQLANLEDMNASVYETHGDTTAPTPKIGCK